MVTRMAQEVRISAGGVCDQGCHVVWCPRYRRLVLAGQVADRCQDLIRAKASQRGWRMATPEIMPDHVHLFVAAHPSRSPSPIASQFKPITWRRLRAQFPQLRSRLSTPYSQWYFAPTAGALSAETAQRHTGTQREWSRRKEWAR
jgi:putative transposase